MRRRLLFALFALTLFLASYALPLPPKIVRPTAQRQAAYDAHVLFDPIEEDNLRLHERMRRRQLLKEMP